LPGALVARDAAADFRIPGQVQGRSRFSC
jgi:hypothetical protein